MRKGTLFLLTLFLMLLLALILGATLAGQGRPSEQYQSEMEALRLKTASKMQAIKIGFWGGLATIALLGLSGITVGLIRSMWRRSRFIHPQANGLFPIVQGRVGGQTYYHDPNRQLAGTVAYGRNAEGTNVHHLTPPNDRGQQLQVTTQAQATQLVAAATQGQGLTAQSRRLAERIASTTAHHPTSHLPKVVIPDTAIPEERLLLAALRRDWEDS